MPAFIPLLVVATLVPGAAHAATVPNASYELKLDDYAIQLRDYQFPSGLRIMFQEEHSQPIVAITSVIDRGSEFDQPDYDGIAHVVEHLAFRTRHGDLPKNMDVIKQLGGTFNASTSVDWTNYMTIAPVDAAVPLLRVEALRMKNGVANVTEKDVRTEAEIARNELRFRYENAAIGAAWDALGNAMYPPGHPYARSTIGNHQTLSNIDLPHAQEFVRDNYIPSNFTVVVVGDFKLDDTWGMVLQAFDQDLDLLMAPEDARSYRALTDPKARNEFLAQWTPRLQDYMLNFKRQPRVDCANRKEPGPPVTQEIQRVKGFVEAETVVLGWSLPGGYCDDGPTMDMVAAKLTSYIYWSLYPTWEYAKQDSPLEGIGCFAGPDEYSSSVMCFIEPKAGGGYASKKLIDKAADALYLQWDRQQLTNPIFKAFNEWSFKYARASSMAGTLLYVDSVASLGGRATATAMFSHFTGDPTMFSRSISAYAQLDPYAVQEMARKYITRDRMVSVIVEPMDEEERQRRESTAQAAKEDKPFEYDGAREEDRFALLFDPKDLTEDAIARVTVVPDRSAIHEFTLDNGLKVAVVPYGSAPLVRVGLSVKGDSNLSTPWGLDRLAEALYWTGGKSDESLLAVAGLMYGSSNTIIEEGSSGNLDALLNKMRWQVEDYDWRMASKKETIDGWETDTKKDGKDADNWATRFRNERMWSDHALANWWKPDRYAEMRTWTLNNIKAWVFHKWQPANAQLVVVGKFDANDAEAAVRKYFDGWQKAPETAAGEVPPMPKPTRQPERQVLVFDKPIATQSNIVLACQAVREDDSQTARIQVVGDVLSEMVWRTLREQSGVTYGAYAYPRFWEGGTAAMYMASLVQNDATGFAVEKMLGIMDRGLKGDIDESALAAAKWSLARSYVLGQQSGDQMLNRLMGVKVGRFDFFDHYPKEIAAVSKADFPTVLAPCVGHEVITVVGPKEYAEKQLTERKIPYEVVDWEALYQSQLTPKELKAYLKEKEAEAKKKAEEAAGGGEKVDDKKK